MSTIKAYQFKDGIYIPNENITNKQKQLIKEKLTFIVKGPNFGFKKKSNKVIRLYCESNNEKTTFLTVPKFFKSPFRLKIIWDSLKTGNETVKNININFKGELKPIQKKVVDQSFDKLYDDLNMLYCLPCGFGKTVLSVYLLSKLKVKTFIFVHTDNILNQWIDSLLKFTDLKAEEIGIINGKNKKISENHKIIISMVQTVMQNNFNEEIIPGDIGLLICDECHHLGAEKFNKVIEKVPSKWYISLSATPKRQDGAEDVYKTCLGYNVYEATAEFKDKINVYVKDYNFSNDFKQKYKFILEGNTQTNYSKILSKITEDYERNAGILKLINELITRGRKIILISLRINQLNFFYDQLTSKNNVKVCRIYNNYNEDFKDHSVLLASYSKANEGLDVPNLDTLILACPVSNIQQCCGRITRGETGITREIYDINDDIMVGSFFKRKKYYSKITDDIIYDNLIN